MFALSGFCLALLRRKTLRRLAIAALGLAVGLLWCAIYQMVFYQPAVDAAGESMQITATVQDYPKQTAYGCSVTAKVELDGRNIQTLLYLPQTAMNLQPGDRLQAEAKLRLSSEGYTDTVDSIYYNAEGVFLIAPPAPMKCFLTAAPLGGICPLSGTTGFNSRLQKLFRRMHRG